MKSKEIRSLFWLIAIVCSIALMGLGASPALAQEEDADELPEILSGGTTDTVEGEMPAEADGQFGDKTQAYWVGAWKCTPAYSTNAYSWTTGGQRYSTSGSGLWYCPIQLPSGVKVTEVRFYYYDNHPQNINLQWGYNSNYTGATTLINTTPSVSSGFANTAWFGNHTVSNGSSRWYWACFNLYYPGGSGHRFWGIRILYERQQGPAGGQIFSDVPPGATFYQSINNLARSGISEGFADGTYRPNQPVTRGQMAAFLGRALGLYWGYPTY